MKNEKKDKTTTVRFTKNEFLLISENAKYTGISVSEYIRIRVLNKNIKKEIISFDENAIKIIDELKNILLQIKKIGVNINQISFLFNKNNVFIRDFSCLKNESREINEKITDVIKMIKKEDQK